LYLLQLSEKANGFPESYADTKEKGLTKLASRGGADSFLSDSLFVCFVIIDMFQHLCILANVILWFYYEDFVCWMRKFCCACVSRYLWYQDALVV
jgi:hypothetical protein